MGMNLGSNLLICHFIDGFNPYNSGAKFIMFQPVFKLDFGQIRAENPNGFGVANNGDDLCIILSEMLAQLLFLYIFCG